MSLHIPEIKKPLGRFESHSYAQTSLRELFPRLGPAPVVVEVHFGNPSSHFAAIAEEHRGVFQFISLDAAPAPIFAIADLGINQFPTVLYCSRYLPASEVLNSTTNSFSLSRWIGIHGHTLLRNGTGRLKALRSQRGGLSVAVLVHRRGDSDVLGRALAVTFSGRLVVTSIADPSPAVLASFDLPPSPLSEPRVFVFPRSAMRPAPAAGAPHVAYAGPMAFDALYSFLYPFAAPPQLPRRAAALCSAATLYAGLPEPTHARHTASKAAEAPEFKSLRLTAATPVPLTRGVEGLLAGGVGCPAATAAELEKHAQCPYPTNLWTTDSTH